MISMLLRAIFFLSLVTIIYVFIPGIMQGNVTVGLFDKPSEISQVAYGIYHGFNLYSVVILTILEKGGMISLGYVLPNVYDADIGKLGDMYKAGWFVGFVALHITIY
jgi:hypothetical protein